MPWQSFAYLLPVVPATVLAVSDLRHRTVPVSWLTAFGLCVLLPSVFLSSVGTILYNMLTNMLLLIWVFGGACIYLKLRYRRPSSLLRQYVGSGDLIFALLLTPLAPLPQYLLLLLGGCLAGLFYWLVVRVVVQRETTIPLVTFLSLPLTAYMSYRFYLSLP
ncbi:prepilin peptidase [Alistipes ihumii]|uniref:prepilin peptidase n=1 Tax=Alistipes ihumii TaxID=1470347 RepID=UPI003A89B035